MAKYTIHAKQSVTGKVVGISFIDGLATLDTEVAEHRRALNYFQRHDYVVTELTESEPEQEPKAPVFEPPPGAPGRSASKADWKTFASTGAPEGLRLTEEQAEALTRDQLAEKYLGSKGD